MQNDISEKKGIELVRSVLKWLAIALSVLGESLAGITNDTQ